MAWSKKRKGYTGYDNLNFACSDIATGCSGVRVTVQLTRLVMTLGTRHQIVDDGCSFWMWSSGHFGLAQGLWLRLRKPRESRMACFNFLKVFKAFPLKRKVFKALEFEKKAKVKNHFSARGNILPQASSQFARQFDTFAGSGRSPGLADDGDNRTSNGTGPAWHASVHALLVCMAIAIDQSVDRMIAFAARLRV
ncbi:hypothetical protein GUJ93_ZPchr0013g36189 [Zizania palustris]|uniref:Uncharacterized protein n=1 Tax=Zizania palustris TaxID=103762 RepID=A0A8J5X662_ZIZPA|nr:hypothetical protein GUJ93_ZPchr0013g36189 [Zizania palustris]